MNKYELDTHIRTSASFFILKDGKPIIRVESLENEGVAETLERIKAALNLPNTADVQRNYEQLTMSIVR